MSYLDMVVGCLFRNWHRSLMAEWLEQASQKVMSLNPGLVELGIHLILSPMPTPLDRVLPQSGSQPLSGWSTYARG